MAVRIKRRCGMARGETAEIQTWEEFKELREEVIVEKKEEALQMAKEWKDPSLTVWMDGLRLEGGEVGAALAYVRDAGWVGRGIYLEKNKEVFDVETVTLATGMDKGSGEGTNILLSLMVANAREYKIGCRLWVEAKDESIYFKPVALIFCFDSLFITRYMRPGGPWQRLCRCPF